MVHVQPFISPLSQPDYKPQGRTWSLFLPLHPRHTGAEPTSEDMCLAVPVTPSSASSRPPWLLLFRCWVLRQVGAPRVGLLRCLFTDAEASTAALLVYKSWAPRGGSGRPEALPSLRTSLTVSTELQSSDVRRCSQRHRAGIITWWRPPTVWIPTSKAAFAGMGCGGSSSRKRSPPPPSVQRLSMCPPPPELCPNLLSRLLWRWRRSSSDLQRTEIARW